MLNSKGIVAAGNLSAGVEGIVEPVENVLTITRIHLVFRISAPKGNEKTIERALKSFATKCPAYQSVKDCIECTWVAEITPIETA